jgi:PKD domain
MKTLFAVLLLPFSALCLFAGCSKNQPAGTSTIVTSTSIVFSGVPLPGQTLTFGCTKAGTTYLWNFGDGSASATQASPTHEYASTGTYHVSLTLNGNTDFVVRQPVTIFADPIYTADMAGARKWRHKLRFSSFSDTVAFADTTFAVAELNPVSLLIGADTLPYINTSVNVLLFTKSLPFKGAGIYALTLGYDHVQSTIYYNKYSRDSAGTFQTEIFNWP